MMQESGTENRMWPYVFCTNCNKLSPLEHDSITGKPECLVCGYVTVPSKAGRRVLLTSKEAELRGLPLVK